MNRRAKEVLRMLRARVAWREEWNIHPVEKPTSHTAQCEVARMLGQVLVEWRKERNRYGL